MNELYLDFGSQEEAGKALRFAAGAGETGATLEDLLRKFVYTRSREPLDSKLLPLSLTELAIHPCNLGGVPVGIVDGTERVGVLDLSGRTAAAERAADGAEEPPEPAELSPRLYPSELTDRAAVELVYEPHLKVIASYLKAGLSVLVECDKAIVPHVFPRTVELSGRGAVLDTEADPRTSGADPTEQLAAMASGAAGLLGRLDELLVDLKDTQTLVLAFLDLLSSGPEGNLTQDSRRLVELLFRHPKASLLGYVDPTLSLPPILATRFPVHLELGGIDRVYKLPDDEIVPTLSLVTLARERDLCQDFDPAALFKHVSGLNPVQYRDAMRFVDATARGPVTRGELISALQTFKKGTGQDVQLPDKTFDDIGGYENLVGRLKQIAALMAGKPLENVPESLRRQLLPQGLLLHGQPGTGKTLLAKALANEMNATIQVVSGPEVMDMYVGESERKIRNLFTTARRNTPSVIIFDEFDAIATQRSDQSDGGNRAGNAVVAQLLTELDGFHEDRDVLVVATTNRIDIIDEALLRPSRFMPIEVQLPDPVARLSIARVHARAYGVADLLPDEALRLVADYSDQLNGDEIRAVFQEAASAHFLERRDVDLELLGSLVGEMRQRREQRRRRHLGPQRSPNPSAD